jgi:glycerol-3-phosphate dehydrogenase (NAD(P)+)
VLGGGSFGTALAQHFACQGHAVRLWVRRPQQAEAINATHHNPAYLSEFALDPRVVATADLAAAVSGAQLWVSGLPSRALRGTLQQLRGLLDAQARSRPLEQQALPTALPEALATALPEALLTALPQALPTALPTALIVGTKGLEDDTLLTMHEVCVEVLGAAFAQRTLSLSGPSFAREMMLQHPTAVVLAGSEPQLCQAVADALFCETFRAYCSEDVVGVEMGGALKNVMAIAAGALLGLGLGDNSRAALITRGVAEITRLAVARGGCAQTLAGLAGVGDLVLTCTGGLSRNRAMGQALGEGLTVPEALAKVGQVAEGVATCRAAFALATKLQVHAPIISAVYQVLYQGQPVRQALLDLVRRAPGKEWD